MNPHRESAHRSVYVNRLTGVSGKSFLKIVAASASVQPRHGKVQKDQIWLRFFGFLNGVYAINGFAHDKFLLLTFKQEPNGQTFVRRRCRRRPIQS